MARELFHVLRVKRLEDARGIQEERFQSRTRITQNNLKPTTSTSYRSSRLRFPWLVLRAMPVAAAFAAVLASAQDFRSPLILSSYSVAFGERQAGESSPPQTVTVVNIGPSPVHITSIAITGDYTQTNDCPEPPAALAKNDACQIKIVFKPSAVENRSGVLTVSQDAAGSGLTAALSGTGVLAGSEIMVSPSSLEFPDQKIGTRSAPQTVTVSNPGEIRALISNIDADGDFTIMPSSTCLGLGGHLAAKASCTVVVTFTPLGLGEREGKVKFTDDAKNSPQTVPLTGMGSAP
jgi:hypothetical protein